MQCNIDARGRAVRLAAGIVTVAIAIILGGLRLAGLLDDDRWWYAAGGLAAFGAFGIFEARAGWCAIRAMGIRTRV